MVTGDVPAFPKRSRNVPGAFPFPRSRRERFDRERYNMLLSFNFCVPVPAVPKRLGNAVTT